MSTPAPAAAADDAHVQALLQAAERAAGAHQDAEAERLIAAAHQVAPEHAQVLAARGVQALRKGDAAQARELLEAAAAREPGNPHVFLNLASCHRSLNEPEAEFKALEQALILEPNFFLALLQKASLQEKLGNVREAARTYHRALSTLRAGMQLPANLQPFVEHAQKVVLASFEELDRWLKERTAAVRARFAGVPQDRVDDCLAALVGKKRIYVSQPTYSYFPRVPAITFFDRTQFPWLKRVEEATDEIRAELFGLLREARGEFAPYLTHSPGEQLGVWRELNQSRRWSALFLYKNGEPQAENIARCPKTVAVLESVPAAVRIAHRGPTWLFSLLEPKTRIPPHTGTTNTRLTVHIPLIVPPNCGFRVGADVRQWVPGTALIFDDTIEHEAWNESDQERVILMFDIWNPLLNPAEQEMMRVATEAIAEFYQD